MTAQTESNKYIVALSAINGLGPKTILKIINYKNKQQLSWKQIWFDLSKYAKYCNLTDEQINSYKNFCQKFNPETYLEFLHQKKITYITYHDEAYPSMLRFIYDSPLVLFIKSKNDLSWSQMPGISIVGSRKMTYYGRQVIDKLVTELSVYEVAVVSGFMYGVDVQSHRKAIENCLTTVGVLGFGFDYMYPASQKKLFNQMLEQGMTFISEYPPNTKPKKGLFVQRNRIIAGLSLATVVVEAAQRSGSLITANLALDYGREVFAVPGPISSIYSEGTKHLINQGACLVSSGQQIIKEILNSWSNEIEIKSKELMLKSQKSIKSSKVKIDHNQAQILNLLKNQSLTADKISELLNLSISQVNVLLTFMEMSQQIKNYQGKWSLVLSG